MERIRKERQRCIKVRQYKRDYRNLCERQIGIPAIQLGLYFFEDPYREWKNLCKREIKKISYIVKNALINPFQVRYDKKILLENNGKKILFLDLDQTLVYSGKELSNPEIEIYYKKNRIAFNVRPFCSYFLRQMSKIYDIYIFTSSKKNYALPIVRHLDHGQSIIKGVLHRQHCLCVGPNCYIKDLALIGNIDLSKMVIIDNSIRSFLLQIHNGIPIQQFRGNNQDRALLSVMGILIKMAKQGDVQEYLKKTLMLAEKISYNEKQCNNYLTKPTDTEKIKKRSSATVKQTKYSIIKVKS